jgi:hypothetical protein
MLRAYQRRTLTAEAPIARVRDCPAPTRAGCGALIAIRAVFPRFEGADYAVIPTEASLHLPETWDRKFLFRN